MAEVVKKGCSLIVGCGFLLGVGAVIAFFCYFLFGHWFADGDMIQEKRAQAKEYNELFASSFDYLSAYDYDAFDTLPCRNELTANTGEIQAIYLDHLEKFKNENYEIEYSDPLTFLTSSAFEQTPVFDKLEKKNAIFVQQDDIEKLFKSRIIAVIVLDYFVAPKIHGSESFDAGYVSGKMLIYDYRIQEIYCVESFEAESGDYIEFTDRNIDLMDENEHLMEELGENTVYELRRILSGINPSLHFRKNITGRDNDL